MGGLNFYTDRYKESLVTVEGRTQDEPLTLDTIVYSPVFEKLPTNAYPDPVKLPFHTIWDKLKLLKIVQFIPSGLVSIAPPPAGYVPYAIH